MLASLRGRTPDESLPVPRDGELTFGRSPGCDLVIGADDPSISRIAGAVAWSGSIWQVHNRSSSRPIYRVEDTGLRTPIPVDGRLPLVDPVTHIAVVGSILTHVITLEWQRAGDATAPTVVTLPGTETTRPLFTRNEFQALVALLEGYLLDLPRHDPRPRTYAEAAERLGVPTATVRKRIERVREKMVESGLVELRQPDARLALAEFLLATRLVTAADLTVLDTAVLETAGRDQPGEAPTGDD
jgi:hypothetical protein